MGNLRDPTQCYNHHSPSIRPYLGPIFFGGGVAFWGGYPLKFPVIPSEFWPNISDHILKLLAHLYGPAIQWRGVDFPMERF